MKIYVGRWDLLTDGWEGYNGLIEKSEEEIASEVGREIATVCGHKDAFIDVYSHKQFEDTFNQDLDSKFSTRDYWIRIF